MPPVLLIDEIDRSDDEFEAFLLELLSDFQVTIPEIGTIRAERRPRVILTSNRTRELHDALKRRCLYHWIGHPELDREIEIVRARVPGVPERLAAEAAAFVGHLRVMDLAKLPGVAETIDWTQALVALGQEELEAGVVDATLGSVRSTTRTSSAFATPGCASWSPARARRRPPCPPPPPATPSSASSSRSGASSARAGSRSGPGRLQDALRSLDQVDLTSREEVYHALRCTLVSRRDDIDAFDMAFAAFWERAPRTSPDQPVDLGLEASAQPPSGLLQRRRAGTTTARPRTSRRRCWSPRRPTRSSAARISPT